MTRLPQQGDRNWGTKLNEFLLVAHQENGELRNARRLVNVRDFGATGNGDHDNHDDTPALQQAIDATAGGGTVYVPAGVYLTRKLFLPSQITIFGEGPASTLKLADNTCDALFTNADWTKGNDHITLRDLCLDGNRAHNNQGNTSFLPGSSAAQDKSHGLNFHFVQDTRLENLTIANFYYDGIYLGSSIPNRYSDQQIDPSSGSNRNLVYHNRITGNGRNGACIERGTDNIIEGNIFQNNNLGVVDPSGAKPDSFQAGAIDIEPNGDWFDVSRNIIQNNQLLENHFNGIQILLKNWNSPSTGILVAGNILYKTGRHGIVAGFASGLMIQGNHISASVAAGMALGLGAGIKDTVVSANVVTQNGSTGILINGAQGERIIVSANVAVSNGQTDPHGYGISWVDAHEVTLVGNVCRNNGAAGAAQMLANGADPIYFANRVEPLNIPSGDRQVKGNDLFASLWQMTGTDQELFLNNQRTGKRYSLPIEEVT